MSARVDTLVKLCSKGPTQDLISNLNVRMETYRSGALALPVSVSDAPNCYLCSPTAAYIDYAIEETRHFAKSPVLKRTLTGLIAACRPLVRATGLDHQVQPNNWLFSTNPMPALSTIAAKTLRDDMVKAHPTRAIVMRSLNDVGDTDTMKALTEAGFLLLPARQVYLLNGSNLRMTKDAKSDLKLLQKSDYSTDDAHHFSADDFTRAAMLYDMLYRGKYTALNPGYSPAFLAQAHQIGVLTITGLRGPDGQLDGVIGRFDNAATMTAPLLGYDTDRPKALGLYRMLTAINHQHAMDTGKFYNRSAGAAAFKRNRGAVPAIEYTAVYVGHLGLQNRIATRALQTVLSRIGVPIMRKYAL